MSDGEVVVVEPVTDAKKEYTDKLRAEYIAEQTAIDPKFVFNEDTWPTKPGWSDTSMPGAPKGAKVPHMQAMFPPGSVVPYLVIAALAAIVILVAI